MCVCIYIYAYICVCICIYIHSKIHQFAILKYFCTNSKTDQRLDFNLYREIPRNLSFSIRWYSSMLHFQRNLLYFKYHLQHHGVNHQVIRCCHKKMVYPNTRVIQDQHICNSTARALCGMMNGVEKGIQE